MKVVKRNRAGNVIKIIAEINTIKELEEYIKNPAERIGKTISDFIKFSEKDISYVANLISSNQFISRTELLRKELSRRIFKYHYKSQREYWLCRGWTEGDTTANVAEYQSKASKETWKARNKNPNNRSSLTTCIEYWIKKGYSKEEAAEKLKERQSTFTLEKCIKKHGEEEGARRYRDRQIQWVNSLYDGKTDEEIIAFEKSKMIDFCKASKKSLKIFLPLIEYLKKESIITDDSQYHIGYANKKEYFLYNKEHQILFFYDFAIPHLKIIIEFNGHVWHPNGDSWKPLGIVKETKEQISKKEKLKEETAIQEGFKFLKVWDTDALPVNLQKCIDFIRLFYPA